MAAQVLASWKQAHRYLSPQWPSPTEALALVWLAPLERLALSAFAKRKRQHQYSPVDSQGHPPERSLMHSGSLIR